MCEREVVVADVGVNKEGSDNGAAGGNVFGKEVGEGCGGGGGRGVEVVEHAVGVGDVDVEGMVIVSAAEGGEHDVEPTIGVVSVHGVVAYCEVSGSIVRESENVRRKVGDDLSRWSVCDEGYIYIFHDM